MIYQMQAEGQFPQRIKLGERAVGWLESEVRDWLAIRIETSRGKTAAPGRTASARRVRLGHKLGGPDTSGFKNSKPAV
jgi:Prophage CP4-57 regulatory protein (AlpA)